MVECGEAGIKRDSVVSIEFRLGKVVRRYCLVVRSKT